MTNIYNGDFLQTSAYRLPNGIYLANAISYVSNKICVAIVVIEDAEVTFIKNIYNELTIGFYYNSGNHLLSVKVDTSGVQTAENSALIYTKLL